MALLSFVIPSNNRTELLDQAVYSIISEPAFTPLCEICISDNSASDTTHNLVASKYLDSGKVVYRRSLDAPSLDANVNMAVSMAHGEYAWIFGDDDLIVRDFLPTLLNYLQDVQPDILIVNSRSFLDLHTFVEQSRVPMDSARVYGPAEDNDFLADFGGYLTYVPCIVIRKSLWSQYFRPEMIGTYFAHIDAVCRAKRKRSVHYLPDPGINMRLENQTWLARHFEIWNIFFPYTIWGLEGYSDDAKRTVIPRYPLKSLKRILASRAYGRFDLKICRAVLIKAKFASMTVKLVGPVIAVLPREWFRLLFVLFIRVFRRKHTRMFSPELALSHLHRTVK